jgi:REP element-mobilizing transposase RayT
MALYKNKYRIESARLKNWNYSYPGYYFITICTKNRDHFFGKIIDNQMHLSEIGRIVEQYWQDIPNHFPFANLDKQVIMPNHIHGIIVINKKQPSFPVETLQCNVSTQHKQISKIMSGISPKPGSLATIIRSFKSISTRTINEKYLSLHFAWQPRFHDHVIRNNNELTKIRLYIVNNPKNWQNDRNNITQKT